MAFSYDPDAFTEAERAILVARAQRLAAAPRVPVVGEVLDLVVLTLGVERYGIDVRFVQEVQPQESVTPLPGVPVFWAGLVNLRGHLCPLLDLRSFLGLAERMPAGRAVGEATPAKVVVVAIAGLEIGLLADDVSEVRQVLKSEIGPALLEPAGPARRPISGMMPDLLAVLDLDALLADPRLQVQAV